MLENWKCEDNAGGTVFRNGNKVLDFNFHDEFFHLLRCEDVSEILTD